MVISILVLIFFLGVLLEYIHQGIVEETAKRRTEIIRLEKVDYWLSVLPQIISANNKFEEFLSFKSYFNSRKLIFWKKETNYLYEKTRQYQFLDIGLEADIIKQIKEFLNYSLFNDDSRQIYNTEFLKREMDATSTFFDNIEGNKLDEQQRIAILKDEDHNLIIAGAGSGKTTTIVGKVKYLVNKQKVMREDILLIAFTKDAVENMRKRVEKEGIANIEIRTFHSFGKKVIRIAEEGVPAVYEYIDDKIKEIFNNKIDSDNFFLNKVNDFFENQINFPLKNELEFTTEGEYFTYLKNADLRTMQGERVKSIDELKIANFFFKNGVSYIYEKTYERVTRDLDYRQYYPDFYLPQYKIYIEHFGIINSSYDVPEFFVRKDKKETYEQAKIRYGQGIEWKRNLHRTHNTTLVETYSYQMNTILFKNLEQQLKSKGVVFSPLTETQIWEKMNKSQGGQTITKNFIQLIVSVINLMKSNKLTLVEVLKKNDNLPSSGEKERNTHFLGIFKIIFEEYQKFLKDNSYIDFGDMIGRATKYVEKGKFDKRYKYILIDEFQDSSFGRYNLIKALLQQNDNCRLFCVGDDWQSIYRFSGSDISIFTEFQKYFG